MFVDDYGTNWKEENMYLILIKWKAKTWQSSSKDIETQRTKRCDIYLVKINWKSKKISTDNDNEHNLTLPTYL